MALVAQIVPYDMTHNAGARWARCAGHAAGLGVCALLGMCRRGSRALAAVALCARGGSVQVSAAGASGWPAPCLLATLPRLAPRPVPRAPLRAGGH